MVSLTKTLGQLSTELSKQLKEKVKVKEVLSVRTSTFAHAIEMNGAYEQLKTNFRDKYSEPPYHLHVVPEWGALVGYVYNSRNPKKK